MSAKPGDIPSEDVIEVIREPAHGAAASAYRAFGETLRGLKTTFARIIEGPHTIQYPDGSFTFSATAC